MAHYSALIVQRRVRSRNGLPSWEAAAPCIRIPTVTGVTTRQEIPGGYTEATFVVPTTLARLDPEDLAPRTTVWLQDGGDTIFHGHIVKSIPQRDGTIQVTLDGAYRKTAKTRMRIVWADDDITQWQTSPGNRSSGQISLTSDGRLEFRMNSNTKHINGEKLTADYFLFGEQVGLRDRKLIDGFLFEQATSSFSDGNFEFRVYGMTDPTDGSPDLLFSSQANSPISLKMVSDGSSGDDTNGWPVQTGYRCIRIGLYCINTVTLGQDANGNPNGDDADRFVSFSQLRCSTRARTIKLLDFHQTSTLVGDLWDDAATGYDVDHLLQEETPGSSNEAVVGNIQNNGQYVAGINYTAWSSPQEIVEGLAALDGYKVAMFGPTRVYVQGSTVSTDTSRQYWYRQPPELIYEDWSGLSDPDYIVRLQRGAEWTPDGQGDELTEATYVNYTNRHSNPQSVFTEDQDQDNYLYEQGWHEAGDWQLNPPVRQQTASTLGDRYNQTLRQPTLSGTLTVTADTPGAIEGRGGERILKLSAVQAGNVVRIVDAKGPQAGRITAIDYTSRGAGGPEQIVFEINGNASAALDRRLNRLALRSSTSRIR
jgi:hypothetical protein